MSPLIFILTMEPFLCTIRNNPDITGLPLDATHSPEMAEFADDLLFFLTKPLVSVPNLLLELKTYEVLSFRVNYQTSEALNISTLTSTQTLLRVDFPFKWYIKTYTKYLGVILPSRVEDAFSVNFPPQLTAIKKDLQSWQQ